MVASKVEYTCPMHPEIVQDHPGSCPKCGMALEANTIIVEEKNEELIDMTRRFCDQRRACLTGFYSGDDRRHDAGLTA